MNNIKYTAEEQTWMKKVIKQDEIEKYLDKGNDFINDSKIIEKLEKNSNPDKSYINDIIQKSLEIKTLNPDETAALLNVKNQDLWEKIYETAGEIKDRVYDNRIVTFAPLYCSNLCVNNCLYCAFRHNNTAEKRKKLSLEKIKAETKVLAGDIGHKRLIVVYGEHPESDANYIAKTIKAIYDVKVPVKIGTGEIRRVNINAAPMSVKDLEMLKDVGIGTYQVFQETYSHSMYKKVHPEGTIKGNYQWRLYAMHRALEAGVDDVAIGALFGLYDWKFEVMALLYHAIELENKFGIGPHTVSFPRLEPAENTPFTKNSKYKVDDSDFKKLLAVIRLSIPYTGMILTARENAKLRREMIPIGITQTDASTRIGLGAYSDTYDKQEADRQQFVLGDTRSLDEVIRELAELGNITSFCTAGYRCGRTGKLIMDTLRNGKEKWFCKLNAVLTFKEWLDDFASEDTKNKGEQLIQREINQIKLKLKDVYPKFKESYEKIKNGERDLYF